MVIIYNYVTLEYPVMLQRGKVDSVINHEWNAGFQPFPPLCCVCYRSTKKNIWTYPYGHIHNLWSLRWLSQSKAGEIFPSLICYQGAESYRLGNNPQPFWEDWAVPALEPMVGKSISQIESLLIRSDAVVPTGQEGGSQNSFHPSQPGWICSLPEELHQCRAQSKIPEIPNPSPGQVPASEFEFISVEFFMPVNGKLLWCTEFSFWGEH